MKHIIRIVLSGIVASILVLFVQELGLFQLLPIAVEGTTSTFYSLLYAKHEIILFILLFLGIFFFFSRAISQKLFNSLEGCLKRYTSQEILMYIIGLAIGLFLANLVSNIIVYERLADIAFIWNILLYLGLGCFGIYLINLKVDEIKGWFNKKGNHTSVAAPKILDTSVIIDGRILDIIKTRFIEGRIIIPTFVLDELRHIADSSDGLKRARGRRGLDILNELRGIKDIPVEISEIDYKQIEEVDSKLLKLAEQLQGMVVTNDFNLNKVAKFQKVTVLNINDLSNAVKSVVLPNEEMRVTIVKEGKEQEQGVAYLNDGTMIVVEKGKKFVGETKKIQVSTVLQTSAGRMIFAKILGE